MKYLSLYAKKPTINHLNCVMIVWKQILLSSFHSIYIVLYDPYLIKRVWLNQFHEESKPLQMRIETFRCWSLLATSYHRNAKCYNNTPERNKMYTNLPILKIAFIFGVSPLWLSFSILFQKP